MSAVAAMRHFTQTATAIETSEIIAIQIRQPSRIGAGHPEVLPEPAMALKLSFHKKQQEGGNPCGAGEQRSQNRNLAEEIFCPRDGPAEIKLHGVVGKILGDHSRARPMRQE